MPYAESSIQPASSKDGTSTRLNGRAPRRAADPKSYARSRLSKRLDLLPHVNDHRSLTYRRFRDITSALIVDQGTAELCSEARIQLIRRFAAAAVLAERLEARLVDGEDIDIQEHALLCSSLVRIANKIGLDRVAKTVPDLDELLAKINNKSNPDNVRDGVERDNITGYGDGDNITINAEPDNRSSTIDAKQTNNEPKGDNVTFGTEPA